MTKKETLKILVVLRAAYPNFYRHMDDEDIEAAANLWFTMFADDDPMAVTAAVKSHIASDLKGFPPHIGAIKAAIVKIMQPDAMTEMEAWGHVAKALRNCAYGSEEEFEKLPTIVQRIVGSPTQLREWGMMDTDTVQSVVQSNFMRSYRARSQSERETLSLPSDVRDMMARIAGDMSQKALEGGLKS